MGSRFPVNPFCFLPIYFFRRLPHARIVQPIELGRVPPTILRNITWLLHDSPTYPFEPRDTLDMACFKVYTKDDVSKGVLGERQKQDRKAQLSRSE